MTGLCIGAGIALAGYFLACGIESAAREIRRAIEELARYG